METPELDKMLVVKEQSQTISEFLDYLDEQEWKICEWDEDGSLDGEDMYRDIRITKEQLMADFFGVNLKKCEEERQQILADLRRENYPD